MEYRFGKLKTNPVRIVKYRFDPININSTLLFVPKLVLTKKNCIQ